MRDPIFEPITINNLKIKNRIYLPAMHLGMARQTRNDLCGVCNSG